MSDAKALVVLLKDVLYDMSNRRGSSPELVRDWRDMIPAGSNWHPGDPGNPACTKCDGTGYIRLEGLPIGHKYFGKIIFCDCAAEKVRKWEAVKELEDDNPQQFRHPATRERIG